MLGLLVKQVALTPVDSPERQTRIAIVWHTGATSELVAMRLTTGNKLRTPEEVVQTIRELAAHMTDVEIAIELNQRGLKSGKGRAFTADSVGWKRLQFQINKPESDPRCVRALGERARWLLLHECAGQKTRRGNSHHSLLAREGGSGSFSGNP